MSAPRRTGIAFFFVGALGATGPGCEGPVEMLPDGSVPPGCTQNVEVDAGGPPIVPRVGPVVAAADLLPLPDGTLAAAVEIWDGRRWQVGAAFADDRAPLLVTLDPPPAGQVPPLAGPRLALSPSGEPAVLYRVPSGTGDFSLWLARAGSASLLAPGGVAEYALAWPDASAPLAFWLPPDGSAVLASRGPGLPGGLRWSDMDAGPRPGGGALLAAAAPRRMILAAVDAQGATTVLVDRALGSYLDGTLRLMRGGPQAYFAAFNPRLLEPLGYLLSTGGSPPEPVAVPGDGPVEGIAQGFGEAWLVVPTDDGRHLLGRLEPAGSIPVPAEIARDGPAARIAFPQPLWVSGPGQIHVCSVRDGRLSIEPLLVGLVCR